MDWQAQAKRLVNVAKKRSPANDAGLRAVPNDPQWARDTRDGTDTSYGDAANDSTDVARMRSDVAPRPKGTMDPNDPACCDDCESYTGSVFSELWQQIKSDPYPLPHDRVSLKAFFSGLQNHFAQAAWRTLNDPRDLLPRFNKLIRPNGACLSGRWKITGTAPYTGCFAPGTDMPIVCRASVTLRETRSGEYRSFGLAGKIFPTPKTDSNQRVRTANFFLIDDNGGTLKRSYLDTDLVSEPTFSVNPSSLKNLPIFIAVTIVQRLADKNSERRQLYPLAEAGLPDGQKPHSPRYMCVRGAPTAVRTGAADFRNELHHARKNGALSFQVLVRDEKTAPWAQIGVIEIDDDVVSDTCDHRLHFSHPRWRNDVP